MNVLPKAIRTHIAEARPDCAIRWDSLQFVTSCPKYDTYTVPVEAEFTEDDGVDFVGTARGNMTIEWGPNKAGSRSAWLDYWVGDWTPVEEGDA